MTSVDDKTKKPASSVESLLTLSALQMPYWVHLAREPTAGQVQARFRLNGIDSTDVLKQAWADTQHQFQCLRATINIAPNQQPVLVIRKSVDSNFTEVDWSEYTETEQQQKIAEWRTTDRQTTLPIEKAPSSRLFCTRLNQNTVYCVWTCHHLLLDGWSSIVVVNSLLKNYQNRLQHSTPLKVRLPDYEDYRKFVDKLPRQISREFWQHALEGFTQPTVFCNNPAEAVSHRVVKHLDKTASQQLTQFCKAQAITVSTAIQIAWALTCAHHLNRTDISFGLVTHGRSLDLAGIENVAGLLANVIPVRAQLDADQPVSQWVKHFQSRQFEARNHEHLSLNEVLSFSEPATRTVAFDSVLAIESLPEIQSEAFERPTISHYASDTVSAFPVSVTVVPAAAMKISIEIQNDLQAESLANHLSEKLHDILTRLPVLSEQSPAALIDGENTLPTTIASPPVFRIRNAGLRNIVSASNELELRVLSIWEEVLQTYPLSMDSNFFASGGNSLGVLRLLANIKTAFDTDVSLAHFIENPTVASMCDYLNTEEKERPIKSLVLLRQGTQNHNLFCLHAGGGHALFYRPLAMRLDDRFSVYALQPKGLGGDAVPGDSVSDMVDEYLQEIVAVQPHGPYNLLCYCFGAALTLEIVKQLQARGEEIGHVIVADAMAPIPSDHPMSRVGWRAYLLYELIAQGQYKNTLLSARSQLFRWLEPVRNLTHNSAVPSSGFDSSTIKSSTANSSAINGFDIKSAESNNSAIDGEVSAEDPAMPPASPHQAPVKNTQSATPARGHVSAVQTACERAFHKYRATPCQSHIHILRSDSSTRKTSFDVFMRHWDTLAPRQTQHMLAETHADIMSEPYVAGTAACVNSIIKHDENPLR